MRFLRSSPDRTANSWTRLRMAAWPTGLVVGLGAEWLARSGQGLAAAMADLAVGWALIGCGLVCWSRRPQSRVGALMALAGFAWFLGTLAGSHIRAVAALGTALLFLHRGPLCQAIVGYPGGRPAGRLSVAVVVVCYVYAVAVPLARSDVVTIVVAVLVLAATIAGCVLASGPDRRARVTAVAAAAALTVPLAGGSVARLLGAGPGAGRAVLWGYEAVLVLIAAGFLADSLYGRWAQAAVTKLVIDLGGDSEAGTLRARLAHALGDRSLTIGYWLPEANGYVDERGNRVELPAPGSGKAVTAVEQDGERIAALVHDAAVLDDPGLVDSVALAARIALSNVRLQADVRRQVAELDASGRRILEVGDAQRRRLQGQLRVRAGQRLAGVSELLDLAARQARTCQDRVTAEGLEAARRDLAEAQAELQELAAGIHPALLAERGLAPALAALAGRAPVPVRLAAPEQRLPPVIETAIYFTCSEALANVAKHAWATSVDVQVRSQDGMVAVVIADDGIGGADRLAGSGLNGVADRVEALGGRFVVQSPAGMGTRLLAEIPAASPAQVPGAPGS
jgi:signal transduction histidine kinase